jgi:hypothetical protein
MATEEKKVLIATLNNMPNMDEETIKKLQEQLSSAKGIILGVEHSDEEVSGYVHMDQEGITDFIKTLVDEFPDVALEIYRYLDGEEEEEVPVGENAKADEIEKRGPPTHYIC